MEQGLAFATLTFLVSKVIEELKYLRNKDWNAAFTLVSVWAAGVIATFLAAAASLTSSLVLPGSTQALGVLDGASLWLAGLTMASFGAKLYDFQKAFDNTDSAKQPALTPLRDGSGVVANKGQIDILRLLVYVIVGIILLIVLFRVLDRL